jgi:hypothetical protein
MSGETLSHREHRRTRILSSSRMPHDALILYGRQAPTCPRCLSPAVRPVSFEGLDARLVRFMCDTCAGSWAELLGVAERERIRGALRGQRGIRNKLPR